jgi:hypothetical protein
MIEMVVFVSFRSIVYLYDLPHDPRATTIESFGEPVLPVAVRAEQGDFA